MKGWQQNQTSTSKTLREGIGYFYKIALNKLKRHPF